MTRPIQPRAPILPVALGTEEPSTVFHGDQRVDTFESILDPVSGPARGEVPEPAAFVAARAFEKAGDVESAFQTWGRAFRDEDSPPAMRGLAAVSAGRLALARDRLAAAEYWCLSAEALAPDVPATQRLRLSLAAERKETDQVLALTERLLMAQPNDLVLLRIRAQALLDDANPDQACQVANRAYEFGEGDPAATVDARIRNARMYAFALTKANRADEAVEVLEKALVLAPADPNLHARIAEYVAPNWADQGTREKVRPHFEAANQAYQRGDGKAVKALALEILAIDKKDGLAHALYSIGQDLIGYQTKPLAPQLDSEAKRGALIQALEITIAEARVQGRAGAVSDLFPEWGMMTELQRSTIAYSVLGYAKLLPALVEKGAKVRFPPPGTSCADPNVDPYADITKKKAFGRMSYVGRGWAYHTKAYVVCGLEHLEDAARAGRNTLTHEMAHLVHFHLRDLAEKVEAKTANVEEKTLAAYYPVIERLYQEAMARQGGQQLLDAYSGTNVWEYFAQGMMGYLAMSDRMKESGPRLYTRNPNLFQLTESLARRLSHYPALSPGPAPPAAGLADSGSAALVVNLKDQARSRHVRTLALGLWTRLGALFEGRDQRPWSVRKLEVSALLSRSRELKLIDQLEAPKSLLSKPAEIIAGMSAAELESQLLLMMENEAKRPALLPIYQGLKDRPAELAEARAALLKVA